MIKLFLVWKLLQFVYRPKLSKKQPLQNSPTKLISAIKIASEHKVSNSAMSKWKSNKPKHTKMLNLSTTGSTSVSTSHKTPSTSANLKQVSKSHPVAAIRNDVCPYQATVTTTEINGCKQKEPKKNSVIVKSETQTGDVLDLSPNKSSLLSFAFNKSKDFTVICNTSSSKNSPAKKTVRINHVWTCNNFFFIKKWFI